MYREHLEQPPPTFRTLEELADVLAVDHGELLAASRDPSFPPSRPDGRYETGAVGLWWNHPDTRG